MKKTDVFGIDAEGPKLTTAGKWLILRAGVLPILGCLIVLDLIGFAIARFVFDSCYGVLCLLP
ncbi:MAG: hypothetical protein AAF337_01780 [Pseudomonadota bacterium]